MHTCAHFCYKFCVVGYENGALWDLCNKSFVTHLAANHCQNKCNFVSTKTIRNTPKPQTCSLTHWGRVTHICVSKLTIIGSDNGLSPDRRQAIIWTNAGLLLIEPLGTNFSEILIEVLTFSFKKMRLKVSSAVKIYQYLWHYHPGPPFTNMVHLRLELM